MKDLCSVNLNGEAEVSEEFVAILVDQNEEVSAYFCANALTLGLAATLVQEAFAASLDECTLEERREIMSILRRQGNIVTDSRGLS